MNINLIHNMDYQDVLFQIHQLQYMVYYLIINMIL